MKKLKRCIEPIIIIILGVFFFIQAIGIKKNPMSMKNDVANVVAQAKFVPILVSSLIIILGIIFLIRELRKTGGLEIKLAKEEFLRLLLLTAIIAAYLISVYFFGFQIPTIVYSVVSVVILNYKNHKWYMIALAIAAYIVVALLILPKLISIRLP